MSSRSLGEIRRLIGLAWPVAVGMIAQYSMGTVDSLMAAQVSAEDLAAIALGFSIWAPLLETLGGVIMAVTPMVANVVGAREPHRAAGITRHGMVLAVLFGILSVWLLNHTGPLFSLLGTDPSLAEKTHNYLAAISWGIPGALIYQAIRSCSDGFGVTRPSMLIALMAMLTNIPLNYILVFGQFGLPRFGAVGCGYASAIVMWLMLAASDQMILHHRKLQQTRQRLFQWQLDYHLLLRMLRLGIPIGCAVFIESTMFAIVALLLSPYGTTVVAAHQITMNISILIYLIPFSIGVALSIRIGQEIGAGNRQHAQFIVRCGLLLSGSIALFNAIVLLLGRHWFANLYTSETDIIDLAAKLLMIAALFHIADSVQTTASGGLRGFRDTKWPLYMAFVSFWLIGLPSGYILARVAHLGAIGYWLGLMMGLICGAVLLSRRLYKLSHKAEP